MARLLVVEDDELLRDALAAQLAHAPHEVVAVANARAAIDVFQAGRYEAVVLDLGLPGGMDGLELLDWMRQRAPALPVLILTARDGIEDRVMGLKRGADDYLTKPFEMTELLARIGSLLRRSQLPAYAPFTGASFARADASALRVEADLPRAWIAGKSTELTQREWELLGLLIANAGHVVSREAVMAAWQSNDGEPLQSNALEVYVHRLRRKLADSGWSIRNIRGLGYMLEQDKARAMPQEG
jgi:two-component system, OmpR family, response regulator